MANLTTSRDDVGTTQARIWYKAGTYYGDSVSYSWSFGSTSQSGWLDLNIYPNQNTKIYNYNATCTITVGKKTITTNANGSTTTNWDYTSYIESASIDIFAHPGSFSMGAISAQENPNSSNSIISNVLTKEKIDDWAQQVNWAYHWWNQNSNNYSPASQTYPDNTKGLRIKRGEPIYAEWFNNCMKAMNQFGKGYKTNYQKDDLITALLINQMNFSGKT